MTASGALRIADANDAFRAAGAGAAAFDGGRWVMTRGVATLAPEHLAAILRQVMTFNAFTHDNDPHGEHDFGSLVVDDRTFFWKIDYYADSTMTYGAEAPAVACYRVLTVMFADEY